MVFLVIALVIAILGAVLYYARKAQQQDFLQQELEEDLSETRNKLVASEKKYIDLDSDLRRQLLNSEEKCKTYENKLAPILSIENEREQQIIHLAQIKDQCRILQERYQVALGVHASLESEIELYKETLDISSYGLYQPKYSFDLPEQYLIELEGIYEKQKEMVKKHTAVWCETEWYVGGSKAEGKKMINHATKLMLFAFNGESDALIAKVRWNNIAKARERILKLFSEINRLGSVNRLEIIHDYLNLKLEELSLAYEHERKKHEQKEEQRLIREQMREEEKAQRELDRVQKEAEEEAKMYEKVLEKAKKELGFASKEEAVELNTKIGELEGKLREALDRKERAISQAQLTKVGNIYVISNIGSFGADIYKIGMTRRFDPMERIKELSDAALPFQFDVHAIIHSENAPQFERGLHKRFWEKRVNLVNNRKEFFKITLDEIQAFVQEQADTQIHFTKIAEAREYRQTLTLLEELMSQPTAVVKEGRFPDAIFDQRID